MTAGRASIAVVLLVVAAPLLVLPALAGPAHQWVPALVASVA